MKVEVDGEDGVAVDLPPSAGGQPTPGEVERHVHQWLRRTAAASRILPTTCRKPVQGLLGLDPVLQRHRGKRLHLIILASHFSAEPAQVEPGSSTQSAATP